MHLTDTVSLYFRARSQIWLRKLHLYLEKNACAIFYSLLPVLHGRPHQITRLCPIISGTNRQVCDKNVTRVEPAVQNGREPGHSSFRRWRPRAEMSPVDRGTGHGDLARLLEEHDHTAHVPTEVLVAALADGALAPSQR